MEFPDVRDILEVATVRDKVRLSIQRTPDITGQITMPVVTARWLIAQLEIAASRAEDGLSEDA